MVLPAPPKCGLPSFGDLVHNTHFAIQSARIARCTGQRCSSILGFRCLHYTHLAPLQCCAYVPLLCIELIPCTQWFSLLLLCPRFNHYNDSSTLSLHHSVHTHTHARTVSLSHSISTCTLYNRLRPRMFATTVVLPNSCRSLRPLSCSFAILPVQLLTSLIGSSHQVATTESSGTGKRTSYRPTRPI